MKAWNFWRNHPDSTIIKIKYSYEFVFVVLAIFRDIRKVDITLEVLAHFGVWNLLTRNDG